MDYPTTLNIGSGKDFRADCLNLDINSYWSPDIVANLNLPFPEKSPYKLRTDRYGDIVIENGYFDQIIAQDVLSQISNLTVAMSSCLELLKINGTFNISVPYDLSLGAWQNPTHVRAFNERSWLYYTQWSWYLGWDESRFEQDNITYIVSEYGQQLQSEGKTIAEIIRTPRAVDSMNVLLRKVLINETDKANLENFRTRG